MIGDFKETVKDNFWVDYLAKKQNKNEDEFQSIVNDDEYDEFGDMSDESMTTNSTYNHDKQNNHDDE